MVSNKPALHELIQTKQDAMINSIVTVKVKGAAHPKGCHRS